MSLAQCFDEVSSDEFALWLARDHLPGMHSDADRRAGLIAAVIANANRNPKKRRKPFLPVDFFTPGAAAAPKTTAEIVAEGRAWAANTNADLRNAAKRRDRAAREAETIREVRD